jgi:lipoprotein NlpI
MMLEIEPRAIIAYKFRGITYFNTDEFNKAKSDFSRYLESDTTDNETYVYRGMTYKILNEPYLAANDFLQGNQPDSASKLNPDELVLSLLKSKGDSIAQTEANRLSQRFPQYPTPYIVLIKILEYNNDWISISNKIDNAIEVVSLYRSESINHSYLLTTKAKQQLKDGKRSEALSTLTNAIRINVGNGNAYFERAKLYLTMNKINNAKQDLIMAKSLGISEAEKLLNENSK